MLLLALDTTLNACSVAVTRDGETRAHLREDMTRGHAERIAPMAREAMMAAGFAFKDIDRIAIATGPGSFTGVRVGLAFARGLAAALGKPCIGVSSLEALAMEAGAAGDHIGWIATPGAVYGALYRDGAALVPPQRFVSQEAGRAALLQLARENVIASGPGAADFCAAAQNVSPQERAAPSALIIAALAAARDPAAHPPAPAYLREPDAKLPARP